MGKRTSIYLTTELDEAITASGHKISELIWRGLSTLDDKPAGDLDSYALLDEQRWTEAEASAQMAGARAVACPHPRQRRTKGGLCMLCGKNVGSLT